MFQFLQRAEQVSDRAAPAIQAPDQHGIDLAAARGFQQFLASFALCRARTHLFYLHDDGPTPTRGVLPQGAILHRESLLIVS
jgi:hypothetical protein